MNIIRNGALIISSLIIGGVAVILLRDFLWNKRLSAYQSKFKLDVNKPISQKRFNQLVMAASSAMVVLFALIVPVRTYYLGDRLLVNAKPVLTQTRLLNLTKQAGFNKNGMLETSMPSVMASGFATDTSMQRVNDVIGTNLQVAGVDEADIIKTDGNTIYYATRSYNRIRIVDVLDNKRVEIKPDLLLGDLYTDSLYLTADYLVVIGYTFEASPYLGCAEGMACIGFGRMFMPSTGTVKVFNRSDLSLAYSLETDSMFSQHRLIDDKLFLVSTKGLYGQAELRPTFKSNVNGVKSESFVDYQDIYYFDDVPGYELSVMTGINLSTLSHTAQAFLGGVDYVYVSASSVYTADIYYDEVVSGMEWAPKVQIMKFDINLAQGSLNYVGQIKLDGVVENQFWMDEYDGYFRIVTTSSIWRNTSSDPNIWSGEVETKNRLFVIKDNLVNDQLEIVGSITQNLGKPRETVKSVRFNKTLAQVVTFEQIDPLYTIDLSDPTNPIITGAIEEPGYSTYLHNWSDTQLIGIGFDVVDGRTNGLKISAYDTNLELPLTTYYLSEKSGDGVFNYSYSEAVYNHKALMISPEKGILAFPVSKFSYTETLTNEGRTYSYSYQSEYLVFMIDFSQFNPKDIISEPIRISHNQKSFDVAIDRGVYVNNVIYTFSFGQLVSYDLSTKQVLENLEFAVIIES